MKRPVHVVAVSARTPVGLSPATAAAAVRARVSRLRLHPFMIDGSGNPLRCGHDPMLRPSLLGPERIAALGAAALRGIVSALTRAQPLSAVLDVALALPERRPGFAESDAHAVLRRLASTSAEGIDLAIRSVGEGHAGALYALSVAAHAVAQGKTEVCVVGGSDSYLEADTLDWLDDDKRLARDGVRGGFPPGEAASFIAIASDEMRQRLELPSLAVVRGLGVAQEPRSWESDEGLLGEGLAQAIWQAAAPLTLPLQKVGDIYCDINGERLRNDDWALAILRTQQIFQDASAYTTCVGEWGDVGAATGALGCSLVVQSWLRGYARAPQAMVWGASWGGLRAACVLEQGVG